MTGGPKTAEVLLDATQEIQLSEQIDPRRV